MMDHIFKGLLNTIDLSIVVIDSTGTISYSNEAWQKTHTVLACPDTSYFSILEKIQPPHALVALRKQIDALLNGEIDSLSFDFNYPSLIDETWYRLKAKVVSSDGERLYLLQHHDVSEAKAISNQVDLLTRVDEATGLSNSRRFDEFYINQWQRSMRNSADLSLIVTEFDMPVPSMNIAKIVAQVFKKHARRACDVAALVSNTRIALVLGQTSLDAASRIAGAIEKELEPMSISEGFSIKIGVSTAMPTLIDTPQVLLDAAEKALATEQGASSSCISNYSSTIIVKAQERPAD